MAIRYNAAGWGTRSNIAVAVTESAGGGLFRGHLPELTSEAIKGNTSATYGIWTGSGKTGTRLNVLLEGTPGLNEILLVPHTGELKRDTSGTVYCYFLGCGSHEIELQELTIALPFVLVDALAKVWHARRITKRIKVGGHEVTIDGNLFTAAGIGGVAGAMGLILRNFTTSVDTALLFNASTQKAIVTALASNPLFEVGDEMRIVGDATTYRGRDISDVTIKLRELDERA